MDGVTRRCNRIKMSATNGDTNSRIPARVLKLIEPSEEEKEFRLKLYPDVSVVEDSKILCTICQKNVKHVFLLKKKSYKHIFLRVAVCKSCMKFYDDGDFSLDEDGDDKYCRWCGQGGTLTLCSKCPSSFCKKCIRRNLERKYLLLVEKDDWECLFCDPKPLYKLRALSWAVDQHLENIKKKEEAQKKKAESTPKSARDKASKTTFIRVEKPEYPELDVNQIDLGDHMETIKFWMDDLVSSRGPVTTWSRFKDCQANQIRTMKTMQDFLAAKVSLENIMDQEIEKLVLLRHQFIEGLSKFKEQFAKRASGEDVVKVIATDENHLNGDAEPNLCENPKARARRNAIKVSEESDKNISKAVGVQTNSCVEAMNDSEIDMFDSSIVTEESVSRENAEVSAVNDPEDKPMIRLRNLSDLMDPKLTNSDKAKKSDNAKKVNNDKKSDNVRKPSVIKKQVSKSKPPEIQKPVEYVTLSSDDDDVPVRAKKVSLKTSEGKRLAKEKPKTGSSKNKILESDDDMQTKEVKNGMVIESDDEVQAIKVVKRGVEVRSSAVDSDVEPAEAELFTPSGSETELEDKGKNKDTPKTDNSSPQPHKNKNTERESDSKKNNLDVSSEKSSGDSEDQNGDKGIEIISDSSDNEKESDSKKKTQEKSSKKIPEASKEKSEDEGSKDNSDSSNSTSSSDPLSESSDEEKKTSPKKINRSYFENTDSDNSVKKKSNNKSSKEIVKQANLFSSCSDSDTDGKALLKKSKSSANPKKSISKKEQKVEKKSKCEEAFEDSDDELDMDIEKLCDLKSLRPKRAHSSGSGSSLSSDGDDPKEKKKSSKKSKQDGDKLSDFYDSHDDQPREEEDDRDEDMETTLKRVFPQFNDDTVLQEDIRASIMNMSSSSERDCKRSEEEEKEESSEERKKKNSEGSKARPGTSKREKTKGRKKFADKLMDVNIDTTDSDEMEKGEKKYEQLKKKRAAKSDKESDEEDTPIVKKKVANSRKGKPRKKIFSDSDFSGNDDASDNESEKEKSESEDSDDGKKKKKKDKRTKSSSDSDSSEPKKIVKKRKRIRTGSDSSSDSEGGGKKDKSLNDSSSKGRKSIRRILKEDDLKQTTQAALKSEQERKKRIADKQKLYNSMVERTSEAHKELTELVLDFNPKTKEKIVTVDPTLVKKLKPHQAEGIKFMWDSCFETMKMAQSKSGSGCILAHCMGLGKSLQVVTLIHTLLTHPEIGVKTILVVAPVSTVLNWANEFDKWLKDVGSGQDVNVFHMTKCQANHRAFLLQDWSRQGGVLIMGYNLLRTLSNPKTRVKATFKKVFQEKLVDPGPDLVVCDEGHILKNEKTAISITMSKMKTRRRIVLTGTPLQNNLVEYHCMVQFVKPNLLGTKKEFTNRFVNPIQNGQFEDSTPYDVKVMKRRAHVLHTMLDGLVQRKDYNVLTPYLPPKFEYVIHLKLSDVQVKLYRYYLLNKVHGGDGEADSAPKGKRLFVDFQNLMWICLHPRTLLMKSVKDEKKAEMEFDDTDEEGSLKEFIDDGKSSSSSDFRSSSSGSESEKSGSEKEKSKPTRRKTRGQGSVSEPEEEPVAAKQWWSDLITEDQMDDIRQSSKLFLFFTILKYCEEIGDKLLIFSQSLYTLDLLEYFLDKIDEETQKPEEDRLPGIKGFEGSWAKGLDYFRLDGSSACENRESWCKSFNRPDNIRARLFLISTRAGGLGINLTGANRVIIFDASWNPSFDVQSLFRVYRFGQSKPCYIYRFLSKGTMEEKIYERQVAKLSTSLRVIDEQQIDRHFSHSALAELYMFDPEGSELQGTPVLPKDRLMAELLQNHSDIILSHHQHDSLLENQEDQGLSEEERKAAWAEFENEKNQKPPVFQNANMMNTLVTMMMEIRTKLKMGNPSWSEDQLRMAALGILQQHPDFKMMAPYINMFFQQQQLQQQRAQQAVNLPTMSNPQFPGMVYPSFQYPLYNNNQQQMNNLAAPRPNMGQITNTGQLQNALLEQLLKQNAATNLNSLLVNPKHAAQNAAQKSGPVIQTVRSLQKVQPPKDATKTTGAGTSTDPITINSILEDPIELNDE
ncbi:hypothetical protein GE061_006874 [Apolygus lucorum]|uniref:ATP-dependent helicase ATRX n=1 Tax=Apolygus lucorum TaxID=248454 RepID=A0A8S9WRW8_APOLU|nr:hypothetical protein GE061_006874 [Apolygus lucorum]